MFEKNNNCKYDSSMRSLLWNQNLIENNQLILSEVLMILKYFITIQKNTQLCTKFQNCSTPQEISEGS